MLGAAYLFLLPPLTDALLIDAAGGARSLVDVRGARPARHLPRHVHAARPRRGVGLTDHGAEYVAWGWAVNGFASVIGSVLTTLIAMTFGFNTVLVLAVAVYLVAIAALWRLRRPIPGSQADDEQPGDDLETVGVGAPA